MKKTVVLLLIALLSLNMYAQGSRVLKQIELKNGTSMVGYVTTQSNGSVMIETQDKDIFIFSPSEISRITNKQDSNTASESDSFQGKRVFLQNGQLLDSSTGNPLVVGDFMSFQSWKQYDEAARTFKTGAGLTKWGLIGGGVGICAFVPVVIIGNTSDRYDDLEGLLISSFCLSCAGAALTAAGLITKGVGKKKLQRVADDYNHSNGYTFEFGVQQYGIGLALKF